VGAGGGNELSHDPPALQVPFVDLREHVRQLRGELDAALARVLDSGWFILGPEVEALERELAAALRARDVVAVANGTEAIQLALEALGVGPGDEVVTSPLSAAFTGLGVLRAGARPVFADLDPVTLNVAPEAVERALTPRTRALLPVHLYGHAADLDPLLELARARGIALVEDACQAFGALYRGRPVGALADAGTLSFYPTKNLGALGDGGAVAVQDEALAQRLRRLRNGGQSDRYRHEIAGVNSRLDEVQAAILRVKLRHVPRWTARRRELAAFYLRELEGAALELPREQPYASAVHHLFVVRHRDRDGLMRRLAARGVGTLVHYPIPLHLQPAFEPLGARAGDFPVAERAAREVLSLPLYPELSDAQALAVVAAVREAAG
jgi:dTDP-4-amino-4,6-dideoxygalactose transaminase